MRKSSAEVVTRSLVGAVAALTLLAAPALARNSDQRAASDAPSPGCSSYVKAEDGSWRQVPCQSVGAGSTPSRARGSRDDREASN